MLRTLRYENNVTFVTYAIYTGLLNIKQRSDFSLQTKSTWNPKLATASEAANHWSTQVPPLSAGDGDDLVWFLLSLRFLFNWSLSSANIEAPQYLSLWSFINWWRTYCRNAPKNRKTAQLFNWRETHCQYLFDLSSTDEESHDIGAPQFLDAR